MKRDPDTIVSWVVVIVFVVLILMASWAQNVQEPEDHGDYYMDTPMYCGQGRC